VDLVLEVSDKTVVRHSAPLNDGPSSSLSLSSLSLYLSLSLSTSLSLSLSLPLSLSHFILLSLSPFISLRGFYSHNERQVRQT